MLPLRPLLAKAIYFLVGSLLLAAPEGIERFCEQQCNVMFYTSAVNNNNNNLDEHGYVIPGLGNAGDAAIGYAYTHWAQNKLINYEQMVINSVIKRTLY